MTKVLRALAVVALRLGAVAVFVLGLVFAFADRGHLVAVVFDLCLAAFGIWAMVKIKRTFRPASATR